MPSPKETKFYLVEVSRAGSPDEIKVVATEPAAKKLRAVLDNVGTTKDIATLTEPASKADKARFIQALLNGEDLTIYIQ